MKSWSSIDEILDFAIGEEEAAAVFYKELAITAKNPAIRSTLEEFSREELGHKERLLAVKAGKTFSPAPMAVTDLRMADYLVDITPSSDMSYQDILIMAMKKEKAAFKLYSDLAAAAEDESVRKVLLGLAQEEAKHKLRFEVEYDNSLTEF